MTQSVREREVRCDGCGSMLTDEQVRRDRETGMFLSCCPERKPLNIDQWRERALEVESDLSKAVEALKFYADRRNYEGAPYSPWTSQVIQDDGSKARFAINHLTRDKG